MDFHWRSNGENWTLVPSRDDGWRITVEKQAPAFWAILIGGRQLRDRYTSVQGAKLDAWQFATSKAIFLFGTRRLHLR